MKMYIHNVNDKEINQNLEKRVCNILSDFGRDEKELILFTTRGLDPPTP